MKRTSSKIKIFGALLVAGGVISGIVRINTELKYGNVASSPHWVPRTPTGIDAMFLAIPAGSLVVAGLIVLIAGYVWDEKDNP